MSGWISLHRKIQDHWVWEEKPFSKGQAWIDILMMVNHEDKKILLGNELIEVRRGCRITSIRQLCERWGWSNTKVRNFLNILEKDNMIVVKSDSKKTTLEVLNYNDYQISNDTKNDSKETDKRQTSDTETTSEHTNNNDNNENNDNKDNKEVYAEIIHAWNELGLAQIKSINSNRLKMVQARVKEFSIEEIVQAIKSIKGSSFLKGQNKNNWIITFDWFIKPNNFVKVLEGNYLDKEANNGINGRNGNNEQSGATPYDYDKFFN